MKISNPIAQKGEELATQFLKDKGYKILERNFRKGYGEIDIICIKNEVLVFVEVKTRTSDKFGKPVEAIGYYKMKSLTKIAEFYKHLNPKLPDQLRIDAVSVEINNETNSVAINHIENISS